MTRRSDGPVTWEDYIGVGLLTEHLTRWRELTDRDLVARSLVSLQARGAYDAEKHGDLADFPPLTVEEHLEGLALGRAISWYLRHPSDLHSAITAGATWEQVAIAIGDDEQEIQQAYRVWVDGQRRLHETTGGTLGLAQAEASEPAGGASR
jgi:hypothetical protein